MSPLLTTFAGAALRDYGFGAGGAAATFELISTQVLSTTLNGGLTFSSIPNTYKHLQLRVVLLADSGDPILLRFNGDSGSNYTEHDLTGNGTNVASTSTGGNPSTFIYTFGSRVGTSASTTIPAVGIIDILDYTSTSKNKTTRALSGVRNASQGEVGLWSGAWLSTAAITSITINPISGAGWNIYAGSRFSLYGIKGA